jgi:hypothetical protein
MILPANEGQGLCRRSESASARERDRGKSRAALQHTSTRDEESVERRGHDAVSLCGFGANDVRTLSFSLDLFMLRSESARQARGDNDFGRMAYKNDQKLKK